MAGVPENSQIPEKKGTRTCSSAASEEIGTAQKHGSKTGLVDLRPTPAGLKLLRISPLGYGGGSASSHISLEHRSTTYRGIVSQRARSANP